MNGRAPGTAREPFPERPGETLVQLREVFCVHRTPEGDAAALQGTTLHVRRTELVCVLGPSGAGKSTLLRVIAGLQTPSAGEVRILGRDIGRLPARARARFRHTRVGFLGQRSDSVLSPDLRVAAAVALPLALRGVPRAQRSARVAELLEAAGVGDRAGALPAELSGGERQRVALCAALAHRPELLLADEPTGELDAVSAAAVRAVIADLTRAHGVTAIIVSHDPATAELSDRAVRMRDGRIVEDRRDGTNALVVGRGGWIRLPPELLADAAIGERARVRTVMGGLMVTPAGDTRRPGDGAGWVDDGAGWVDDGAGRVDDGAGRVDDGAGRVDDGAPRVDDGAGRVDDRARAKDGAPGWDAARVELHALGRGYGRGAAARQVIDGLTVVLDPGRMTAVTGRSGSGKTTLLRLIGGLETPGGGEVVIDGLRLGDCNRERLASLLRERIGYLPQEPSPIGFLTAEENIVLALRLRGWELAAASERATVVLSRLGLADRARQRVARLSAGEAQRVALARALAGARGLLIVDEPTSRLDEANAAAAGELLAAAAARDHQTVICATHDEQLIRRADEVLALGG